MLLLTPWSRAPKSNLASLYMPSNYLYVMRKVTMAVGAALTLLGLMRGLGCMGEVIKLLPVFKCPVLFGIVVENGHSKGKTIIQSAPTALL